MLDRILKALIVAGLFANVAAYTSRKAQADDYAITSELQAIESQVSSTARSVEQLAHGTCSNSKLC